MLRAELIRPLCEIVREHAVQRPRKVAFADRRREVTYGELERRTRRLAGHLSGLWLQPGDRAMIFLGNRVEVVEAFVAVSRAGGVVVPFNPAASGAELAYALDDSGARVIITDAAHLDQVRRLLPGRSHLRVVVTGPESLPRTGSRGLLSFEELATTEPAAPPRDDQGLDDPAYMLYTSGTTGNPKGVISTQRSCQWSIAACYAPIVGLNEDDKVLWPLPLHHSLAHILCVLGVTTVGATARLLDSFTPQDILGALREDRYTFMAGVPAMYHYLVGAAAAASASEPLDVSSLRLCLTAGSICPGALRDSFEQTFGVPLIDGYGSTETCGLMAVNWPTGARVDGSCGLPVPGLGLRVVDPETGLDVPAGTEGEVWVRGPSLMLGYHNQPEATAEATAGGWYHTGDLARGNEFGYLTITGRSRELIIRSGENMHPAEIEEVLLSVPGVADAAVVGRPHDVLGEVPIAFVVPGPSGFDAEELFAACRDRLSGFKVPEELYEIDEIPRTSSGKITRHLLLDRPARLRAAASGQHESLLRIAWSPLPSTPLSSVAAAADGSDVSVVSLAPAGFTTAVEARREVTGVIEAWLHDQDPSAVRLVLVTRGAVSTGDGEPIGDLAHASAWGLLRAVQAEHPDRIQIVDVDDDPSPELLAEAVATGEPQIAVRGGIALVPRLTRVSTAVDSGAGPRLDPRGTVVIAGATGPRGVELVKHLVTAYRAKHLLLLGPSDDTTARLMADLHELGAKPVLADCDVTDRVALQAALGKTRRPVTAVVHGDAEWRTGFDAIATGVANLHELTADADLAAFVLLGSVPGALGRPRHPEEAATAAYLDAFARFRRDRGLPATSVAWDTSLPVPDCLALFDLAARMDLAGCVVLRLAGLDLVDDGTVPLLLRDLVDLTPRPHLDEQEQSELRAQLAARPASVILGLVQRAAAEVLGMPVDGRTAGRTFRELGVTSVGAVQLRDRLIAATGLTLPGAVVFDYPTVEALAGHLRAALLGRADEPEPIDLGAGVPDEPIAVVGMACRFPGGIRTPEDLWQLVGAGGEALGEFPADRGWDLDTLHAGASATRVGGFLPDAAEFDAEFFGISPREALAMDPQQRLVLETTWELAERAGIDPRSLRGTRTGVFAGVMYHDYGADLPAPPTGTEAYWGIGTAGSVVSGRVAYTLGLEGPAVSVDTACSSSLVALHLAGQALRAGECDLAMAGGVTVMSTPRTFIEFTQQGGLAADGRCKAFSEDADGTGWSEGVGFLLLERLSDAERNGHEVLAVLRGSAVNQDGASNGLTAPNGPSQQRVIRQALASAGLRSADVDVVEAHGTGTSLGDPIEAQALLSTYGRDRSSPLLLGSVKSNIGHTQAAAGVAGVIKMVQAMRHGVVPRTLHASSPSSHVDWASGAVELAVDSTPWPSVDRPRRAGVSAFGISGTNAHVILEQASSSSSSSLSSEPPAWVPLVVSAASTPALDAQIASLSGEDAYDVGFSLATGRAHLEHRAALVAGPDGLTEVARGVATGDTLAVLFAGQGSQREGMGRTLHARFPAFAAAYDEVLTRLDIGDDLDRTGNAQPAIFALEVALFRLASSLGVKPDYLAGHSIGEIAAAHVAGILSLDDACTLVSARARLMQALPAGGAMVAVRASEAEVLPLLTANVSLAAVNGPASVVVSGAEDEVQAVLDRLGRESTRLNVSHAFHSPLMTPMLADFAAVVAELTFHPPVIPVVAAGDMTSPQFWVDHVRDAVRFADTVTRLVDEGVGTFLELGPRAVLTPLVAELAPAAVAVPMLRKDTDEELSVVTALGRLHVAGVPIDWAAFFPGARRVSLPTYPFQRRRFWPEAPARAVAGGDDAFWSLVDNGGLGAALRVDASVEGVLRPALTSWRDRQRRHSTVDGWCYRESWQRLEPAAGSGAAGPSAGAPGASAGAAGASAGAAGASVGSRPAAFDNGIGSGPAGRWLVVVPDAETEVPLPDAVPREVVVFGDPTRARHRDPVTAFDQGSGGEDFAGVLSLLAMPAAHPGGLTRTIELIQALGAAGIDAPLWCVTRGAVAAAPGDVVSSPDSTAVWGLGRVAALEFPRRWGGLIDLPSATPLSAGASSTTSSSAGAPAASLSTGDMSAGDMSATDAIARVLAGACAGEDQIALRGGTAYGRRLVRASAATPGNKPWRSRGTVLVTGGTGGLGGRVARWLAGRGAEHLVLVSRRGPGADGADKLRTDLEGLGVKVTLAACDVADRDALAALLAEHPVDAVFHAAGVDTGDGPIETLDSASLAALVRAKATAAQNLHELAGDLDAFVMFSSGAATWGSGGQPGYSAANAFLDGLAQQRRAEGRPAVSIAWGAWAGAGLASDPAVAAAMRRRGVLPMDPDLALLAMRRALEEDAVTLTVADIDWDRFVPGFTTARPSALLSGFVTAAPAPSAGTPRHFSGREVEDLVRAEVAAVLGHDTGAAIGLDKSFRDQGFDSMTAVEVRNRLHKATGLDLPPSLVYDHPTPRAVATYLLSNLGGGEAVGTPTAELERFETALAGADGADRQMLATRLENILAGLRAQPAARKPEADISTASVDDLFAIIDEELQDFA
ncbi:SDR family NAD(P)-dependent oxidoreductase [Actinoplanes bogorensis]|uniref:SDR family NAD(P)-dependent oxidoreductase n=1 Tax=Paractinoplanes bogorensis TaxID=1610840 RepID=A0ABS5YK54_9ACTN|nr:type I polyketide synthase [Actinoplanes bogorensis]MBU2663850.1 SDR family NAD(P)-dependent oxidoreductase [Actinoplanes bogorensis]